jgi:transposase
MLSLPLPVKIFWSLAPTDMRKSFDGLSAIVAEQLRQDPLSGHLFIFTSRRRDRVKLLYFERGGLAIWYKRLEEGTFAVPRPAGDSQSVQLSSDELALLLSGVDLASVRRRKRYERRPA